MTFSALSAPPSPVIQCLFPISDFGPEIGADWSDFRAYFSLGRASPLVFSDLRQPSLHADERFDEANAERHIQDNPSRMPDQPATQAHHALHDGALSTVCRLFQPDNPGFDQRLSQHAQDVVHQDPELEDRLVDIELPERQALQVESAFQPREVLLARASIEVHTQDVGIGHLLEVRPDAEDLVLQQDQGLPLLACPLGHLLDQPDSSDYFAVPAGASHVDGLAGPGEMGFSFLHGQVDLDLGLFPTQIVASDETVTCLASRRHECRIVEGRVIHPEQAGLGQLAHPLADPGMEVQGPFMRGVVVPWTKLGSHDQPTFKERACRSETENPVVVLGDALLLGVAVVESGGVGVDSYANKVRHGDNPGFEIHLAQHAHGAHGHGVVDIAVKAHGLETLPQGCLRRNTTNPKGCREELAVIELPQVVKPHLAYGDKPAKAPQDVLLSDLIWGIPLGADGINVADAHEFAHGCKPGIADVRLLGNLKCQFSYQAHLSGEHVFPQSCEGNKLKF